MITNKYNSYCKEGLEVFIGTKFKANEMFNSMQETKKKLFERIQMSFKLVFFKYY